MNILAIETSCDETACAVVKDGIKKLASTVSSSKELHEKTAGVVPEIAARKQVEYIVPVIENTLEQFIKEAQDIDAIAVTTGPGLIGSLVIGVEAAKTLSFVWDKPLIPVNHLVGHIYANFVDCLEVPQFPAVALVVSGGHTDLVLLRSHKNMEYLGGTLDDAAGEAFDKTARLLGLAKYLGGVQLSKLAASCTDNKALGVLPRPMIERDDYNFSFSGLKTAVKRLVDGERGGGKFDSASIACEFENAVVDVLINKTQKALTNYKVCSLILGGGVAANTQLRTRAKLLAQEKDVTFHVPSNELCGDNAVYIGAAAFFNKKYKNINKVKANPSLQITDKA